MITHEKCMEDHILPLLKELRERGFHIHGELTEGHWFNIHCKDCGCTHEVTMQGGVED